MKQKGFFCYYGLKCNIYTAVYIAQDILQGSQENKNKLMVVFPSHSTPISFLFSIN